MVQSANRTAELKQILNGHRQALQDELQSRLREGRMHTTKEVVDIGEDSDNVHEAVIGFSLLQMRADMLGRVDEALMRLDAGQYGDCADCGDAIAERRLRALPFAVRCRACESHREQARFTANKTTRELGAPEVTMRSGRRALAAQG